MAAANGVEDGALDALIRRRAQDAPERPYLEDAGSAGLVTFAGLARAAQGWRGVLDASRARAGATVGIAVADPLRFALTFLGVVAADRVAAPLDPGAPDHELARACALLEPDLVVADRPPPGETAEPWLQIESVPDREPEEVTTIPASAEGAAPQRLAAVAEGGVVLASSGTSGQPKLIQLSGRQLLHNGSAIAAHHAFSASDRGFNPLPLYHINAEVVGLLATLVAGATLVVSDRFHRQGFWDLVSRRRVTWINAVPAVIARLVPLGPGESVPASLQFVRSASAPLPVALMQRFEATCHVPILESYGMTEAGSQITANPRRGVRKPGSVGLPVEIELRLVTDRSRGRGPHRGPADPMPSSDGLAAGLSPTGRVEIRGRGVISAYRDGAHPESFDAEGWLDTGDLGRLDGDGYLYLVGRTDDVINRGGEKIYPRDIEEVLLQEPRLAAAAVVARSDPALGQVPVAYLVPADPQVAGQPEARQRLVGVARALCQAQLARSKQPVAYLVVERLPTGTNGKVRRRLIPQLTAGHS